METRNGSLYCACALLVFAVAMLIYSDPVVFSNEAAYLIPSRRMFDPGFLAHDWEVAVRSSGAATSVFFDILVAPFWAFLDEPYVVATSLRIVLIFAIVTSLFFFLRELGAVPVYAAIGLCVWLLFGQSIAAGAWIIGGAEKKVLAYVFVLLSLVFCLRGKLLLGGLFAGLAVSAHVLVGCWYGLAAVSSIVVVQKKLDSTVIGFCLAAAVPALPIMISALLFATDGIAQADSYMGAATSELIVAKRNPHHGDPAVFLNFRQAVEAIVFFSAAFFAVNFTLSDRHKVFMTTFLGCLLAFWVAGLAARWGHAYGLLFLFPFRIGDVLVPMIVAALGISAFLRAVSRCRQSSGWRQLAINLGGVGALLLAGVLFFDVAISKGPRLVHGTISSWQASASRSEHPTTRVSAWIRNNTASTQVFLAPPLAYWFKLEAERPVVASFKGAPGNGAIHEWFERMEWLTGGAPIERSGYEMIDWAEIAYAELSPSKIVAAGRHYCADYYLVEQERADLRDAIVFSAGPWYLYSVAKIDGRFAENRSGAQNSFVGVKQNVTPCR